jgi:hypothetical protein
VKEDNDDRRSGGPFPRHGDGEDVACELPHLDALLWLNGPRSGLGHFFVFENQFFVSAGISNIHYSSNLLCRSMPTGTKDAQFFCISLIVSFFITDTKNEFTIDTTNYF